MNTIKWVLISLNVISALVMIFFCHLDVKIHRFDADLTYRVFKAAGVLNEQPGFDIRQQLGEIGKGGKGALRLAWIGAIACLINAVAIGFLCKEPESGLQALESD